MSELIYDKAAGAKKAAQIIASHSDCISMEDVKDAILRKVNKARECGLHLDGFVKDYKEQPIYNESGERIPLKRLFSGEGNSNVTFPFSYMTARRYIRLYKANPEEITELAVGVRNLHDAMIACEAIALPSGHGEQHRTEATYLDKFTKCVQSVIGLFKAREEKGGWQAWTIGELQHADAETDQLLQWKAQIREQIKARLG